MSEENFMDKLMGEIDVVKRHLQILKIIQREGPIGIIKLSEKTGLPSHKVRYSLRVLETHHLVEPSANGAIITEKTENFMHTLGKTIEEIERKVKELAEDVPR